MARKPESAVPMNEPHFLSHSGNRLAYRLDEPSGGASLAPLVVWLGGFNSDMRGTKAQRLADLAQREGFAFLRFDYSGHGESGGAFSDGTISIWRGDAEALITAQEAGRPLLLVGSSMGAWISLLIAIDRAKAKRPIAAMILLAPAPDFTSDLIEPTLTNAQRYDLNALGYFEEPSDYGPEATRYTRALIEDGRANRVMTGMIETHCPVTILQGLADPDVPHSHALKLMSFLPMENAALTLIKDGDHRLSREQDLILLERVVVDCVAAIKNA
jgi:pimeloyl-ACP methyl ester carboxylesterase